jgi:hypothetical protein
VREPSRGKKRDVVVARNDEERSGEAAQIGGRRLVLDPPAAVRQVAAAHDECGIDTRYELRDRSLEPRFVEAVPRAEVEVGHVEDARRHRRSRLQ